LRPKRSRSAATKSNESAISEPKFPT
jgi:hypothetical protein